MLNGHGDDIFNQKKKIKINFSSNILNRQETPDLYEHLFARMSFIHSYPEPDAHSLAEVLARKHKVEVENLCVTNGATEAIYLVAQTFSGCRTGIIIPTFSEYEDACRMHGHQLSFYRNLEEMPSNLDMLWLCNPNNPNGKTYDLGFLTKFVEKNKQTLFIVDQSYADFTELPVWKVEEAARYENLILLHSMTKQYAVPGLRLGYVTANFQLIQKIEKFRMPWSVNTLAVEAGKFLVEKSLKALNLYDYLGESKRLQDKLRRITGLTVFPSSTPFFLCRLEHKTSASLKLRLIENHGILIREASNFRGLDEHYFRIATQSPEENDLLEDAIREWINN